MVVVELGTEMIFCNYSFYLPLFHAAEMVNFVEQGEKPMTSLQAYFLDIFFFAEVEFTEGVMNMDIHINYIHSVPAGGSDLCFAYPVVDLLIVDLLVLCISYSHIFNIFPIENLFLFFLDTECGIFFPIQNLAFFFHYEENIQIYLPSRNATIQTLWITLMHQCVHVETFVIHMLQLKLKKNKGLALRTSKIDLIYLLQEFCVTAGMFSECQGEKKATRKFSGQRASEEQVLHHFATQSSDSDE
ncbi:hypothetical protein ACJX0J_019160 [Zea mays]